jgi:phosphonate transport system substrate-binding protein
MPTHRPFAWLCLWLSLSLGTLPVPAAEPDPLAVGIFPRRNATITAQMFNPLMDYLSQGLQRPVRLVISKDFEAFWQQVEGQRLDLVHFNQYHLLKARRFGYRVILSNREFGSDSMAGALYVRKDSPITEVAQLAGRKIVFGGGEDAMMAHIVPRYLLQAAGLKAGDYQADFALNPPNAVMAVVNGQADAAGAGDVVQQFLKDPADQAAVRVLAQGEPMRQLPWAVREALDPSLRAELVRLLLALNDSAEGRAILEQAGLSGLAVAREADYASCRAAAEAVFGAVD